MSSYGTITDQSGATILCIQSADPQDLQARINAVLDGSSQVIVNLTLAGAGDGHTFVALLVLAAAVDVEGGLTAGSAQVVCYEAGSGEDLVAAREAAGSPAPLVNPSPPPDTVPYALVDEQMAGSSKGTRFMGLGVYVLSNTPSSVNTAFAGTEVEGDLTAGANIATLTSLISNNKFDLVTPEALQYQGDVAIFALFDASITLQLTAAGAFPAAVTVDIIYDPNGTPVVIASMAVSVKAASDIESVAVNAVAALFPTAVSPIADRVGIQITCPAGSDGSIISGRFRAAAL